MTAPKVTSSGKKIPTVESLPPSQLAEVIADMTAEMVAATIADLTAVEDEDDPPLCDDCGVAEASHDGLCYPCAAQPYGHLWQLEQTERY